MARLSRRTWAHLALLLLALPARADPGAALEAARAATARGAFAEAAAALRPALSEGPRDYALWLAYAQALLGARAYAEAAPAFQRAAEISDGAAPARLGLADALLGAARYPEARAALEPLVAERPADPALLDRLALALFWCGDLDGAERRYRAALAAAPADRDAALGLAWVAQRRGDAATARAGFQAALAEEPSSLSARQGLEALGPAWRLALTSAASAELGAAGPPALGLSLGAEAVAADRWRLGARYRRLGSPEFAQDEGHLSLGYAAPAFGLAAHVGAVGYRSAPSDAPAAHSGVMLGLSGRATLGVDLLGSVTYSAYDDLGVAQGELGALVPLGSRLSLYAGGRAQASGGKLYLSALGELRLTLGPWAAAIGGGYGDQLRPVDLATSTLYNTSALLSWRGYARQSLQLTRWLGLSAAYEYERYGAGTDAEAGAHRLTAGLTLSF